MKVSNTGRSQPEIERVFFFLAFWPSQAKNRYEASHNSNSVPSVAIFVLNNMISSIKQIYLKACKDTCQKGKGYSHSLLSQPQRKALTDYISCSFKAQTQKAFYLF